MPRSPARGLQSSPHEECEPQATELKSVIPILPKAAHGRPKKSSRPPVILQRDKREWMV